MLTVSPSTERMILWAAAAFLVVLALDVVLSEVLRVPPVRGSAPVAPEQPAVSPESGAAPVVPAPEGESE